MTSTRASGCNLISVLLPIILAGMIVVVMLVMGRASAPYSIPLRTVVPTEGSFYRLECVVNETRPGVFRVCDEEICLEAAVMPTVRAQLKTGVRVIASGVYREGKFQVTSVLTRCPHGDAR